MFTRDRTFWSLLLLLSSALHSPKQKWLVHAMEHPYMVSMTSGYQSIYDSHVSSFKAYCGTLVTLDWLITSQFVPTSDYVLSDRKILAGRPSNYVYGDDSTAKYNRTELFPGVKEFEGSVESMPGVFGPTLVHFEPFELSRSIKPATLPPKPGFVDKCKNLTMVGYAGSDSSVQTHSIDSTSVMLLRCDQNVPPSLLCFRGETYGSVSDEYMGSALICKGYLVGVVAKVPWAWPFTTAVAYNISQYTQWIHDTTGAEVPFLQSPQTKRIMPVGGEEEEEVVTIGKVVEAPTVSFKSGASLTATPSWKILLAFGLALLFS